MPKVKLSPYDDIERNIRSTLARVQALNDYSDDDMAKLLGFTKKTYQNKKKSPRDFHMRDLIIIDRKFKFTDEEKLKFFIIQR